ncbi:MAG: energy transducer TonB [Henriciella sp.]|nr:energy transducer TonB [Henriciella sp.]
MKSIYALILVCLIHLGLPAMAQKTGISEIVAAQKSLADGPSDATRAGLLAALDDYSGPPAVESVNAYMSLVSSDSASGDTAKMRESALAAAAHFEPVKDIIPQQYAETKYVAAVAYFNDDPEPDAMLEMAHVEGFTKAYRDSLGERPDWATNLGWKADAWGIAMEAYFESDRKKPPSDAEINAILAAYPVPQDATETASDNPLPQCAGRMIQRPKMRYPSGKARRGMYGAVILGFELDPEGRVVNPEILASIPIEEFDEKSLQTVGKWRFKPDDPDQVGVSCRLERSNVVQPLIFQIG